MNKDGAFNLDDGKSSIGGVLHDSKGKLDSGVLQEYCGFSYTGRTLAHFGGIQLALTRGHAQIVVETDSMQAIEFCRKGILQTCHSHWSGECIVSDGVAEAYSSDAFLVSSR